MAIKTNCPKCDRAYNLADTMAGKNVKCKDCAHVFKVSAGNGVVAAKPPTQKAKPSPTATTRTVKPAVKPKKSIADDEGESASARRTKPAKGGLNKWVLIGGGGAVLMLMLMCGGLGFGAWALWGGSSKVTLENYNKLRSGMTESEVIDILGKQTRNEPLPAGSMGIDKINVWESGKNNITVTFAGGKVFIFAALLDGKVYLGNNSQEQKPKADPPKTEPPKTEPPKTSPPPTTPASTTPPPTNKFTLENFQKITGGSTETDLQNLLGGPTNRNAPPDADSVNYDRTSVHLWQSGPDSITVTYCAGRAARWIGVFNGQTYGPKVDTNYVLNKPTPPPSPTTRITKENFDKIKGGMNQGDLQSLLGNSSQRNVAPDTGATGFVSARGKMEIWRNGADTITVGYNPTGQSAYWSANIAGQAYGPTSDPNYAVRPTNPNPTPTTQVTLANFNRIQNGMTGEQLAQVFGAPANVTQPTTTPANPKTKQPASSKFTATWNDGQGGTMAVHFTNNMVTSKTQNRLR